MIPLAGITTLNILNLPVHPDAVFFNFAPFLKKSSSMIYNPAGLNWIDNHNVSVLMNFLPTLDMRILYLTGAHRFKRTVAGVCVSYFGEGKQGYTEDTPSSRVYFRPYLLSIGGAFLFKFLGFSANVFRYSIYNWSSYGLWLSIGTFLKKRNAALSVTLRNLGVDSYGQLLPLSLHCFGTFMISFKKTFYFYPVLGLNFYLSENPQIAFGLWFKYRFIMFFSGLSWRLFQSSVNIQPGAGVSVRYRNWQMKYGFYWKDIIGLNHSISVEVDF